MVIGFMHGLVVAVALAVNVGRTTGVVEAIPAGKPGAPLQLVIRGAAAEYLYNQIVFNEPMPDHVPLQKPMPVGKKGIRCEWDELSKHPEYVCMMSVSSNGIEGGVK